MSFSSLSGKGSKSPGRGNSAVKGKSDDEKSANYVVKAHVCLTRFQKDGNKPIRIVHAAATTAACGLQTALSLLTFDDYAIKRTKQKTVGAPAMYTHYHVEMDLSDGTVVHLERNGNGICIGKGILHGKYKVRTLNFNVSSGVSLEDLEEFRRKEDKKWYDLHDNNCKRTAYALVKFLGNHTYADFGDFRDKMQKRFLDVNW